MKAVWYTRQGPAADVLTFGEQPTPDPGPGEVRVRLHASGVNPADVNRRGGIGYGMEGPLVIPHSDGAGMIDAVGAGVAPALLGRRVWLYNGQRGGRTFGTAAEAIALDVALVAELPAGVSFAEGACLGIPCMTAHRCVTLAGDLRGRTVLVTGGAGAVGHHAIQWARRLGARAIATASSADKAGHAQAAGAEAVVDYRAPDADTRLRQLAGRDGLHHVVDVDFGGNLPLLLPLVAVNGSIAFYATRGDPTPPLPATDLMRRNISVHGVLLNNTPLAARKQAQADIVAWLREGGMQHTIDAVHPLRDTVAAHVRVESGRKRGTVVVDCSG